MATWFERDSRRFDAELVIMTRFSRARLNRNGSTLFWTERVISEIRRVPYEIKIVYPERFPLRRPQAFIDRPRITNEPHLLTNGELCLFGDPWGCEPNVTAVVIRNRAIGWILAYERWCQTGNWEAPEVGH